MTMQEEQSQPVSQVPPTRQLLAQLPLHGTPKDRALIQKVLSELLQRYSSSTASALKLTVEHTKQGQHEA